MAALPYEKALEVVLADCTPLEATSVALDEARGRVLARAPRVDAPIPSFANSAMDGFAVRASDLAAGPAELLLAPRVAAGSAAASLALGHAAPVATGAPIPEGADAVVPIEDARRDGDTVHLPGGVRVGRHVREAGSDLPAGAAPLAAGTLLGPAEGALLASIGAAQVQVRRRPRVALVATGSELVPLDEAPGPAQIRDSNSTALAWACRALGAEVTPLGIAPDEPEPLAALLARGLEADVLVTSAGVSVGERDLVRAALADLGVEERFWGVDIKPGRPCAFGVRGTTLAFSLPGNPASSLVCLELFVRPALRAMAGYAEPRPSLLPATAGAGFPPVERRLHAVRCRTRPGPKGLVAAPTGDQGSHRIGSLVGASALALIGPGRAVEPGEPVQLLPTTT